MSLRNIQTVVKCCALILICQLTFGMAELGRCADLVVVEVHDPDWNADRNSTEVKVEIKNIGKAISMQTGVLLSDFDPSEKELKRLSLERSFRQQLIRERETLESDHYFERILQIPELKPKESIEIIFEISDYWVYDPICELIVRVNFDGSAPECNRKNNVNHFLSSI